MERERDIPQDAFYEYCHAPQQRAIRYAAVKWCNDRNNPRLRRFLPKFKESYVYSLSYVKRTDDPALPPCVNCPPEAVYYCSKFQIECKSVVGFYGGRCRSTNRKPRQRKSTEREEVKDVRTQKEVQEA